jgi:hypothetical protein
MQFTKHMGHGGIREGRRSAMIYGVSLNENTRFLTGIQFPMKLPEIASAKLNGIIGF